MSSNLLDKAREQVAKERARREEEEPKRAEEAKSAKATEEELEAKKEKKREEDAASYGQEGAEKSNFSSRRNPSGTSPDLYNTQIALDRLGVQCSFDEFHGRCITEHKTVPPGTNRDTAALVLRKVIRDKFGFDPSTQTVIDAINYEAWINRFDPVRDYLDGLKWDGTPRLDRWLTLSVGAPDNEYTRAVARLLLIAGVRRVREPGSKFDIAVILEGPQGCGKSETLRALALTDENFTPEPVVHLDARAQQETLCGKWIVELAELEGMRKAEVEKVKHFLSKTHDRAREAFGRTGAHDQPRRCIFIGTTNDSQYLRDSTGNRRFLPIRCTAVDKAAAKKREAWVRQNRDQLWAEAAAAEAAGGPLALPEHLQEWAEREQAERLSTDPWEHTLAAKLPRIAKTINGEQRILSKVIFERILGIDPRSMHGHEDRRLADCMRKLGWDGPKNQRIEGEKGNGYWRDDDDADRAEQPQLDLRKKMDGE